MKNKKATDIFYCIVLFAAWVLPGFKNSIYIETGILFSVFVLSCVVFFFLKDLKIRNIALLLLTAAASVYKYEYLLLYFPVFIMIIMYHSLACKENEKTVEICNTVYTTAIMFKIFYIAFLFIKKEGAFDGRWLFYVKVAGIIIAFFLMLLIASYKKGKKINKKKLKQLNVFYWFSVVGIVIDVVILLLKPVQGEFQAPQFGLMAWVVLVLSIFYFKDPVTELFFHDINSNVMGFLNSDRQSK